jgi:hypothetical protein
MEKVLRESDDVILIYVAPTKTLVNQIAAEVYARFSKDLNESQYFAILSLYSLLILPTRELLGDSHSRLSHSRYVCAS